jgi:DNA-binding beta-propeller fold protein YncE
VSRDGKHAFVTHLLGNFQMVPFRVDMGWINTNVVSIIDIERGKWMSTVGLDEFHLGCGNPWGLVVSEDGEWVCVSNAGTNELSLIQKSEVVSDYAKRTMSPMMGVWPIYPGLGETLWARFTLQGIGPRGLAARGTKIYVAEYFSDSISILDLEDLEGEPVRHLPLGPPPTLTAERRGEMLFHDATICYQRWQSCASCHPDGRQDALVWDLMNDGVANPKNTKSMLFSHRTPPAMARGVREGAEEAVRAGLSGILFVNRTEEEAAAIDAYLKSLRPVPSPRLVNGQLSPAAIRGKELYHSKRVACHRCHPAPLYTDLKAHNVGTRSVHDANERYDTPTLVEVWRTAPYLHDGRYTTLRELFVEGKHGLERPRGEPLSEQETADLVEFVSSL